MPSYQGRALLRESRHRRPSGRLRRVAKVLAAIAVVAALAHVPWGDLRRRFAVVSEIDVRGAQLMGMQGWLVKTGRFRKEDLARGIWPDRVLGSIVELVMD